MTHAVANTVKRVAVIVITVRRSLLTARRPPLTAHRPPPPAHRPPAALRWPVVISRHLSSSRLSRMQVLYFRNPMTPLGTAGTTMAILGVLLYSLAKARDDRMNA